MWWGARFPTPHITALAGTDEALARALPFASFVTSPWVLGLILNFLFSSETGVLGDETLCEVLVSGDPRVKPGSSDTAVLYYLSLMLTLLCERSYLEGR